jgi:adenylate kinase
MLNIVICGAPGSGKGSQSALIVQKYNLKHLSTGDLLRKEIADGTKLGKEAEKYICKGHLVPDDLIINMISKEFDNEKGEFQGFVLDGFPRTLPQAAALNEMLAQKDAKINAFIELDVEEKELIERLLKRGKTSGRSDDNLETIKKRLEVFHKQTAPIGAYYKKQNKYHIIRGIGSIREIFEIISSIIDKIKE